MQGKATSVAALDAPEAPSLTSNAPRTKVGFVSLGCPKNLVDSEVMMGMLHSAGAEITAEASDADVIVVNTCSFIDSAKQESVNAILEMTQHKRAAGGRAQKLVVAGCLVERYRTEIQKNIPEVDAVVGTGELETILGATGIEGAGSLPVQQGPFTILQSRPESTYSRPDATVSLTARAEGTAREQSGRFSRDGWDGAVSDLPNYLYTENTPRLLSTPKHSAYIKIAEGCDHPCSFCIIPQLRGKFRSRRFESVVAEAERLARQGVREITLIGQDTTCYGEDLGLKDGLAQLLARLAAVEELRWVRFLYAYPNKITGKLLETIATHDKICSYIDVPLQHGAGNVLKRMKRGANADIFLTSIERMRATIPNLTLRTAFIVGFPGETEQDFAELSDLVRAAEFDWLGVFNYSDEDGSPAHALDGKLTSREIEGRRRKLMAMQKQISRRKLKTLIGREMDILVTGPSEESDLLWEGRTERHAPEIDGKVYINDFGAREPGEPGFYRCEITESHDYDLVARIVQQL